MNRNIEIINENLWAVNREYVRMGYIQELVFFPSCSNSENPYASLKNDGTLILDSESEFYPILKQLLPRIMKYSDEKLLLAIKELKEIKEIKNPDGYEKMLLNVLEWEEKRRCVKVKYLASLPKLTFKDKLLRWIMEKRKRG